jgi:hypothetical protein
MQGIYHKGGTKGDTRQLPRYWSFESYRRSTRQCSKALSTGNEHKERSVAEGASQGTKAGRRVRDPQLGVAREIQESRKDGGARVNGMEMETRCVERKRQGKRFRRPRSC